MEQARTEQAIARQCELSRLPLPEAIRNAPELLPGLSLYYEAFLEMSPSRGHTMMGEELRLNWKELHEYCSIYDIEGEQKEDFLMIMRHFDDNYIMYKRDKKSES